ncbi:phage terminase large subunit family protein [Candidatus Pacearchaeota archaeon]|nr:phage terminase large subunit family protein [Candidatus Pacearchaeota archaeon]
MTIEEHLEDIFAKIPEPTDRISPSKYAEKFRWLTSDVTTSPGRVNYDDIPYARAIIDSLSPNHPGKIFGVMKSAQIAFTEMVVVNGILYLIANNPCNIMALSHDDEASKEMVESRLDQGIKSCNIQHLIRPNTVRKRNSRTGDTSRSKEFIGGRAYFGGYSVDKMGKQRSVKVAFFDDWDKVKISDKDQGNLFEIVQARFTSAADSMKQYYISTPETKPSNIESVCKLGDESYWHVPCPKCGDFIKILWNETVNGEKAGVVFSLDSIGRVVRNSVGYVCQSCSNHFKETYKYEMNLSGIWTPSSEPQEDQIYSWYLNSLTAPPWCFGWEQYANQWARIFKSGLESKSRLKVFLNLVLGQPWEETKTDIKSGSLMKNTRPYDHGIIPNELAEKDGNGRIILLTCACDLNGTIDDARLDYEVLGHSMTGSTYSIDQGSIGTYEPGDKTDRPKWTYRNEEKNNVWDHFYNAIVLREYPCDNDNPPMKMFITGVDTGYYAHYAYAFIDQFEGHSVVGIKGGSEEKKMKAGQDLPKFKPARERPKLFIIQTDLIKDDMAERISLPWSKKTEISQPPGFMNFPNPDNHQNKYTDYYFKQFENEQRVVDENDEGDAVGWKWKRKYSSAPNHYMDCFVYNMALRDIFSTLFMKELGIKYSTWADFVTEMKKYL